MIHTTSFLNDQECQDILEKIYQLKTHWTQRYPMFCTLGTALYLDAANHSDFSSYQNKMKKTNKILLKHFPLLYHRLKEILQEELKEDVFYEETLALPGFHIFNTPQNEEELFLIQQFPPSIHFDLQFLQAKWTYKQMETHRPISFTAAIKLPAHGSGLNYWDITYKDYHNLSVPEKDALFLSKKCHYCPYQEGKIAIHHGLTLHQIAIPTKYTKDDVRITLQGHLIRCDKAWRVYW